MNPETAVTFIRSHFNQVFFAVYMCTMVHYVYVYYGALCVCVLWCTMCMCTMVHYVYVYYGAYVYVYYGTLCVCVLWFTMHIWMCTCMFTCVTQLTNLQLPCADIPSIKSSKGLPHNTVHTTPCHTKLSSVNLKSTRNRVQFMYLCDAEGLVTAVTVLSSLYLPVDGNIRAPSTTSEVSVVAYDDSTTLNILCEFYELCSERELLFVS